MADINTVSPAGHKLVGKTFRPPQSNCIWTVMNYHRNGAWLCREPDFNTTCCFYEDDIIRHDGQWEKVDQDEWASFLCKFPRTYATEWKQGTVDRMIHKRGPFDEGSDHSLEVIAEVRYLVNEKEYWVDRSRTP
jgi:hypothetical protein